MRKSYSTTDAFSIVKEPNILRYKAVSHQNLRDLPTFRLFPYSCQYCVYWESTDDFDERISKEKALQLKSDWFRSVSKEFGDCGVIAYLNDEPVGYAQYALPKFFARAQQYKSGPPSADSVFLACLYIPKREIRGKGIGKSLLDFVLSDLQKRGYNTIETFARKGLESNPTGPLEFYLKQGFSVKRECDEFPLVRKEFGTAITC
jgi:GNAT superfamily N-acetyltransferase